MRPRLSTETPMCCTDFMVGKRKKEKEKKCEHKSSNRNPALLKFNYKSSDKKKIPPSRVRQSPGAFPPRRGRRRTPAARRGHTEVMEGSEYEMGTIFSSQQTFFYEREQKNAHHMCIEYQIFSLQNIYIAGRQGYKHEE